MNNIKIAMIQARVAFGRQADNFARAHDLLLAACAQGAQVAVLPECFDLGWTCSQAPQLAQPIPGPSSDTLCSWAREQRIYLAAGLTERDADKLYNTAVFISPDGEILLKHRKINILADVEGQYGVGDRLGVAQTPLGTFGLNICADNLQDALPIGETLCRMGAQVILSPSSWAVPPANPRKTYGEEWLVPYAQLGRLYSVGVVGVSNVGQVPQGAWKGWSCIGNSIATGPDGQPLTVLPFGEEAECFGIVDMPMLPRPATGTGWQEHLQSKK